MVWTKKFKCIGCEWRVAIWKLKKWWIEGKWSDQGQLSIELDKEEDYFSMKNKKIS